MNFIFWEMVNFSENVKWGLGLHCVTVHQPPNMVQDTTTTNSTFHNNFILLHFFPFFSRTSMSLLMVCALTSELVDLQKTYPMLCCHTHGEMKRTIVKWVSAHTHMHIALALCITRHIPAQKAFSWYIWIYGKLWKKNVYNGNESTIAILDDDDNFAPNTRTYIYTSFSVVLLSFLQNKWMSTRWWLCLSAYKSEFTLNFFYRLSWNDAQMHTTPCALHTVCTKQNVIDKMNDTHTHTHSQWNFHFVSFSFAYLFIHSFGRSMFYCTWSMLNGIQILPLSLALSRFSTIFPSATEFNARYFVAQPPSTEKTLTKVKKMR